MDDSGWGRLAVSRRGVVVTGGVVVAGAVLSSGAPTGVVNPFVLPFVPTVARTGMWVERIRRASDMLVANLAVKGLSHVTISGTAYLAAGSVPGYLGLVLPGQSVGEHTPEGSFPVPIPGELAQPTILGFQVPAFSRIPYDIDALLDLASLTELYDAPGVGPQTRIEAPYRLEIQPHSFLSWLNDTAPKALTTGRLRSTELWHARLASFNIGGDGRPDHRADLFKVVKVPRRYLGSGVMTPLTDTDRKDIVSVASAFEPVPNGSGKVAKGPVAVNEVILTSVGATLDLHGEWPGANVLKAWDHRATLGRDNYVRVVKAGWLAPFGHQAILFQETFRRMRHRPEVVQFGTQEETEAQLVRQDTLIINQPVADTSFATWRAGFTPDRGLDFPFTSVRCVQRALTGVSNGATLGDGGGVVMSYAAGAPGPIQVSFVGTDHKGRQIPFSSAVWFQPGEDPRLVEPERQGWSRWNDEMPPVRRATVPNLDVTIAPEHPAHPGLTTLPMVGMTVQVLTIGSLVPPWRPVATRIGADLPGISALSSSSLPVEHEYHPLYVKNPANKGGVVLRVPPTGVEAGGTSIDPKSTGGLVPMPAYQGLSSIAGAVMASGPAALQKLGSGSLPSIVDLFGGLKLFGTLELSAIIKSLVGTVDDALTSIPGVTHEIRDGRVYVDMDLTFPLQFKRVDPLAFRPSGEPLRLKAHAEGGAGGPSETFIDARLRRVALEFANAIALPIVEMRALWESGAKPTFTFEIENVRFLGHFSFLQPLSDLLQLGAVESDGSGSGAGSGAGAGYRDRAGTIVTGAALAPSSGGAEGVDAFVDDEGLHLVAEYGVPDVKIGVFTLTGLNFGARVDVPFVGDGITVHFYFASYENPFMVTYSGFGGTGFVDIAITGGGKQVIKASLGVAATLGIDLVVASGSLSVNVGLILTIECGGGAPELSLQAFFRISGSVSVPLICTVSVLFELILEFRPGANGKPSLLTGTARFLLKVDTLIYDEEVEARLSKTFKGGRGVPSLGADDDPFESGPAAWGSTAQMTGADRTLAGDFEDSPTFRTVHPDATTWQQYAAAFAKDPA